MERIFAELDNNMVTALVAVNEEDCLDDNELFSEQVGANYLRQVYRDATFIETRHDGSIRKKYAAIGDTYSNDADLFYNPVAPYPSWTLDNNFDWQPPTPMPDDGNLYYWNEDSLGWVPVPFEEPDPQE